jgi:hypothetical protein
MQVGGNIKINLRGIRRLDGPGAMAGFFENSYYIRFDVYTAVTMKRILLKLLLARLLFSPG